MKNLIFLLFITTVVLAKPITLKELKDEIKNSHPFYQIQNEMRDMKDSQIKGDYSSSEFILNASGANTFEGDEDGEFEYSLGLSKNLSFGDRRTTQIEIAKLQSNSQLLKMKGEMLSFSNDIARAYHQSCLDREQKESFKKLFYEFKTLYQKKLKAYKYKDISKKELLQLKIEKADLYQKLESLKTEELMSKNSLLELLNGSDKTRVFSCKDLYKMEFDYGENDDLFSLSRESYHNLLKSEKLTTNLYNRSFESIDLSLGYDDEIDTKRYGIGLSLPLSFTSSKNEYKKISSIHRVKLIKLQEQKDLIERKREFNRLKTKLSNEKRIVIKTEKNISTFKNKLLPLIEKSYQLGESSVVEYLLSKQKLFRLQDSLNEHKKGYYNTLFDLINISEINNIKLKKDRK